MCCLTTSMGAGGWVGGSRGANICSLAGHLRSALSLNMVAELHSWLLLLLALALQLLCVSLRACRWNPRGVRRNEEHGTSHVSVVDAQRNAVSLTSSVR